MEEEGSPRDRGDNVKSIKEQLRYDRHLDRGDARILLVQPVRHVQLQRHDRSDAEDGPIVGQVREEQVNIGGWRIRSAIDDRRKNAHERISGILNAASMTT